MILWNTAILAVAAVVVALILPKEFRAATAIFPPEEESFSLSGLSSFLSGNGLLSSRASLPLLATPSDIYAAVLKSRTLRDELIDRFQLEQVYHAKNRDAAFRRLEHTMSVKVGPEGIVAVRVYDRDPQRAADICNAAIEILDRLNREKRHGAASEARQFIEKRLAQNVVELRAAEDSLRGIQESTQVFVPDEQARAVIEAAAQVEVQLLLREVDLGVLSSQVGPQHPERMAVEREVNSLRQQLSALEAGRSSGEQTRFDIPLKDYPARSLRYLRALREVKVQEAIYELLTQQYEQFRIQESRDTPTVQVLDRAVPPLLKARPIRSLLCIGITAVGFVLSVLLAGALEWLRQTRERAPARFEQLRRIAREMGMEPWLERIR